MRRAWFKCHVGWMASVVVIVAAHPCAAQHGLRLKAAFFTTGVSSDVAPLGLAVIERDTPSLDKLWFYSEVACDGDCPGGAPTHVLLLHRWFLLVGGDWLELDRIRHVMKQLPGTAGYRFPSNKEATRLQVGRYRVTVTANGKELCLGGGACEFIIDVR